MNKLLNLFISLLFIAKKKNEYIYINIIKYISNRKYEKDE